VKHIVLIEGKKRVLDIRAMDENFIIWRKLITPPLNAMNMKTSDPEYLEQGYTDGRFQVFNEFFRKQIQIIGSCMILAWDGDGVVGKMHFTTREVHAAFNGPEQWDAETCYCVDHDGFAPAIQSFSDEDLTHLMKSPSRILRILCFNIGHTNPKWHGQGIAKVMVNYLQKWAYEHNWLGIEIQSCPDIVPPSVIGDWMLRRGALEHLGFRIIREFQTPADEAHLRLQQINSFRAGYRNFPKWCDWYSKNVHRFTQDEKWKTDYDKNYIMMCDVPQYLNNLGDRHAIA
jgi:GNAT superfamily N-acetyltransferase